MRKKFTIEVEIDTDTNLDSLRMMGIIPQTCLRGIAKDRYAISVVNDTLPEVKDEHDVLCGLVHELGHAVGYALELPRSIVDPRLSVFLAEKIRLFHQETAYTTQKRKPGIWAKRW